MSITPKLFRSYSKRLKLVPNKVPIEVPIYASKNDIHHLVKHDIEMCADRQVIIVSTAEDIQNIDPLALEITASYDASSKKYTYKVSLTRYEKLLFQEVHIGIVPWDFCGINPEIIYGVKGFQRNEDPFKLIYKNGKIEFWDVLGYGIFKIFPDVHDHFYVTSRLHANKIEIISLFKDIVYSRPRKDAETKAKLTVWLINKFLILQCAQHKLEGKTFTEGLVQVDPDYVKKAIEDLKFAFEHVIENLLPDTKSLQTKGLISTDQVEDFFIFTMTLRNLVALADHQKLNDEELFAALNEFKQIDTVLEITPSCVALLFYDTSKLEKVKSNLVEFNQSVCGYYTNFISREMPTFLEKGLLWRFSISFWRFIRQGLLKDMISRAYGVRLIVPIGGKEIPMQESCLRVLELPNVEVFVCDNGIAWREKFAEKPKMHKIYFKVGHISSTLDIFVQENRFLVFFIQFHRQKQVNYKTLAWVDLEQFSMTTEPVVCNTPIGFYNVATHCVKDKSLMLIEKEDREPSSQLYEVDISDVTNCKIVSKRDIEYILKQLAARANHRYKLNTIDDLPHRMKIHQVSNCMILQFILNREDGSVSQYLYCYLKQTNPSVDLVASFHKRHRDVHFLNFKKLTQTTLIFTPNSVPQIKAVVILFSKGLEFNMIVLTERNFQNVYGWRSSRSVLKHLSPAKQPEDVVNEIDRSDNSNHLLACWSATKSRLFFVDVWKHKGTLSAHLEYTLIKIKLTKH